MTLKANLQGTGASYGAAHAICGELGNNVTAAGSTQATATLLPRLTRHYVASGTGGVIVPPGVGLGDALQFGDEIEITNATLSTINVYPPTGYNFLNYATNAAVTLSSTFSLSVLVVSGTLLVARYYQVNSGSAGSGTVTSVGLSLPSSILSVSGSPIIAAGTLTGTLQTQIANTVWAGPTTGAAAQPTFRALVASDIPALSYAPPTSGSSILYGNGSGGFSNVTVAASLSFSGGTLGMSANQKTADITWVMDGGGSALSTGISGDLRIDFDCTITANTLLADQSGSMVVDVWKDTYANYPPTGADSICASAKPTISAAAKSTDSTLTGWTVAITAGDTLRFNVDSCSTITRATLILKVVKT